MKRRRFRLFRAVHTEEARRAPLVWFLNVETNYDIVDSSIRSPLPLPIVYRSRQPVPFLRPSRPSLFRIALLYREHSVFDTPSRLPLDMTAEHPQACLHVVVVERAELDS